MKTKGVKTQSVLVRLMLPIATLLMCVVMAIGGTFALWTTDTTAKVHLQAGTLNVTLGRKKLVYTKLNSDGTLSRVEDEEEKDFSGTTTASDNVFGVPEKIVPGMYFEATMTIKNSGVVACDYVVLIQYTGSNRTGNDKEADNAFAQQLTIYVYDETGTKKTSGKLSELAEKTEENGGIYNKTLTTDNRTDTFTVKLEFPEIEGNAQNGEVNFDLLVRAEQKTTA